MSLCLTGWYLTGFFPPAQHLVVPTKRKTFTIMLKKLPQQAVFEIFCVQQTNERSKSTLPFLLGPFLNTSSFFQMQPLGRGGGFPGRIMVYECWSPLQKAVSAPRLGGGGHCPCKLSPLDIKAVYGELFQHENFRGEK